MTRSPRTRNTASHPRDQAPPTPKPAAPPDPDPDPDPDPPPDPDPHPVPTASDQRQQALLYGMHLALQSAHLITSAGQFAMTIGDPLDCARCGSTPYWWFV